MTLKEAIYKRLTETADVQARVRGRIYTNSRPSGKEVPLLVFSRISDVSLNGSTGPNGTKQARIQVDCFARYDAEAEELAEVVQNTLAGWSRTEAPVIGAAQIVAEYDDTEPEDDGGGKMLHVVRQDYSIWYAA